MSCARGKTRVQYEFGLPDGSTRSFSVEVGPDRVDSGPAEPPPWAALYFHKCPHCPLDVAEEPFCPAAMSIASLAEAVDGLWCHDMVSLKVRTPERFYSFTPVSLQLRGESVATSGDYMQYLTPDMSLHHILDPRTGSSPTHTSGVSVVAPSAMAADAFVDRLAGARPTGGDGASRPPRGNRGNDRYEGSGRAEVERAGPVHGVRASLLRRQRIFF